MQFWNNIILEALTRFKSETVEPEGRSKSQFSIRNKDNWDDIYETLELARDTYQKAGGPVGWLRKIRRKAADNVAPVAGAAFIALKVVPDNTYSTPVLGAVGVLLDAVKQAASVRKEALEGFDGLITIFSDVELFLGEFPGDSHIEEASRELAVVILTALEHAIGFFISNEYSQETQKIMKRMLKGQQQLQEGMQTGFSAMSRLFTEHLISKDAIIEQKERELAVERQEKLYLVAENERLRSISPILPIPWMPSIHPQVPIQGWYMDQETLRNLLNTRDLDYVDMTFIIDKKAQLPARQQVQAEQVVNTSLFRDWLVSASSAKLLIQWNTNPPQTIAEVSPLSIFCMTMTKALQARERLLAIQWFCGRRIDPAEAGPYVGGHAMLASLIDQLLRQLAFETRPLQHVLDPASLKAGSPNELQKLLDWLVRQLPQTITLFCIIDGVVLYERDEHWEEGSPVLAYLLRLTTDPSVQVAVKVLFTSVPGPCDIRGPFEEKKLILDIGTLPRQAWTPSEERIARELGNSLG
ncbi:hypothetical protein VM1G_11211 [Cytospora mali]|uniref:Fungal STAND N-terminal Goodbye domain-containing protein n=1 Tax=Cytospora mali TaxID=578113 RepID=A0A194VJU5_CYTMA|nr:hypothetical protein VM1G_11211 [Valsa mali]